VAINSRMICSGHVSWQLFENFTDMIDESTLELGIAGASINFTADKAARYQCKITIFELPLIDAKNCVFSRSLFFVFNDMSMWSFLRSKKIHIRFF
jgi:hypothetical protein